MVPANHSAKQVDQLFNLRRVSFESDELAESVDKMRVVKSALEAFTGAIWIRRSVAKLTEASEGLELGEGKPSRPVLKGPGGRKAAWLLGSYPKGPLKSGCDTHSALPKRIAQDLTG